jgi:arylsulfatase A-like enzyme
MIDIPVTIAHIADASMPWADGESFLPILRGEATQHRREILEMMPAPPPEANLAYRGWAAIRKGKWRYIRWDSGKTELYDHSKDPWETRDRAEAKPGVVASLDARLDELIADSRG